MMGRGAAAGGLVLQAGGSIVDAIKATAFAFIQIGVWKGVGQFVLDVGLAADAIGKGLVHGIVGGALSVAQGGNFLQGFASNALGAATGVISTTTPIGDNLVLDTAFVAAIGGISAELTGGKFANGAITAAFANLYNKWQTKLRELQIRVRWRQMVVEFKASLGEAYQMGRRFAVVDYIRQVEETGPWDFKNRVEYRWLPGVEEFGNFAFGATGAAWLDGNPLVPPLRGLSEQVLLRGAGGYQEFFQPNNYDPNDGHLWDWNAMTSNFGDNFRDRVNIMSGIDYYYRTRDEK